MKAFEFSFRCGASVLAVLTVALGGIPVHGASAAKQLDAFPVFDSYIKVSGKAAAVTGNAAAYAERVRGPENGTYGIEALHFGKDVNKDTTMEIDGRALTGAEDYLGKLKLTKSEVGSVEVGYKRFRTFYDGIGGFFPLGQTWLPLGNEELHTDRGNFWMDVNIALPNQPVFHLRYSNQLREGRKDSTIWGDSDLTGIPVFYGTGSSNPVSSNRKLAASYIDLSERQKVLEATMTHTLGNTEIELSVVNNRTNSDDTRWINRYPGELKPYPALTSSTPKVLSSNTLANNYTHGFDEQISKADVWTYTGKFETTLSEQCTVFGGLSYQDAEADIAGNRQIQLQLKTRTGVVDAVGGFVGSSGRPPYSYRTNDGNTSETVLTGNLGVNYKPLKDLFISLAIKGEELSMDGKNEVTYTSNKIDQNTGVVTPMLVVAPNLSERHERPWTPELDVRYSGIKNVALYGTVDYRYAPGSEYGSSGGVGTGGVASAPVVSSDNSKENHGHYKVGANWTISPMLSVRAETFYKDHVNNYNGYGTSAGSFYILGYQFYGNKLTVIVKPLSTVTLTTRYVRQTGTMDTESDAGAVYESMDSKSQTFAETIDWMPNNQIYVQANVNVVFATVQTAYPRAGGLANDVLRNADNNYWNGNVIVGFVLDKTTDAQIEYTRYHAGNYDPSSPPSAFSYGMSTNEYTVTCGVKKKLTDRLIGNAKIGYISSQNATTGGHTNFRGPMAYVALDYAL